MSIWGPGYPEQDVLVNHEQVVLVNHLKTATGTIPFAVGDHTLLTFPAGKTILNGKIRVIGLWVERNAGEWFSYSCGRFNANWTDFHLHTRGPSLLCFYTGMRGGISWARNYRLEYIELP